MGGGGGCSFFLCLQGIGISEKKIAGVSTHCIGYCMLNEIVLMPPNVVHDKTTTKDKTWISK